jgi:hypothetical protein
MSGIPDRMPDFSDTDVSVQGFCGVLQLTLRFPDARWELEPDTIAQVRADSLVNEGLVRRVQGRGTFVA